MSSLDLSLSHAVVENNILAFVKDPPDTEFQLGYLFALCDVLVEMGGQDYGEFAIMCKEKMRGFE